LLSEKNGTMSTSDENQESHIALEKASISSNKGEWRTYSAHFLLVSSLMIQPIVMFWRSLHTSSNANNEPLAKIALCV